jgi:hypothetical protein
MAALTLSVPSAPSVSAPRIDEAVARIEAAFSLFPLCVSVPLW